MLGEPEKGRRRRTQCERENKSHTRRERERKRGNGRERCGTTQVSGGSVLPPGPIRGLGLHSAGTLAPGHMVQDRLGLHPPEVTSFKVSSGFLFHSSLKHVGYFISHNATQAHLHPAGPTGMSTCRRCNQQHELRPPVPSSGSGPPWLRGTTPTPSARLTGVSALSLRVSSPSGVRGHILGLTHFLNVIVMCVLHQILQNNLISLYKEAGLSSGTSGKRSFGPKAEHLN